MNKHSFIEHFVVTFLASWTANEYDDACAQGQHDRLKEPPVEDAYDLAEAAWKHKNEVGPK